MKSSEEIFSSTETKRYIAYNLEGSTRHIVQYLLSLYLYPRSPETKEWRKQAFCLLHNVCKQKYRNKYPMKQFILKNTIQKYEEDIEIWYKNIIHEYSGCYEYEARPDPSVEEASEMIHRYYDWLAEELSEAGEVTPTVTYARMRMMGF